MNSFISFYYDHFFETAKLKTEGLQGFIDKVKQITRLDTFTSELVHEFIEKIVVSAPNYTDGKRHQEVEIHYNGVALSES